MCAPVVGVEDPPRFEVGDESFDRGSEGRDDSVVLFVAFAEFSAWWGLTWGDDAAPLVAFIADSAAGFFDDLGDRCGGERFRIVGASWKGIGNVDGVSVKETDQLCVESNRAVFAAPQLGVVLVGPARGDGAVY
jgi:hypothetical protein